MNKPIRYTPQKQQERISRRQFCERLEEFGWIAGRPDEDLGEGFIVHIYFQGRATGVTFHVQLKSVTNLTERRQGDYLVYDFEVKDLKHWADFSMPVALVIWDVKLREGRWALVDAVIRDLDQRRPQWRTNKSKVRVHIPWANTTDNAGFVQLKQSIGRYFYPLITTNKPLEGIQMKFKFPNMKEGRLAYVTLERVIKEGEPGLVKAEFIEDFNLEKIPEPLFLEYLKKIASIQKKTGQFIRLSGQELAKTDIEAINELVEIIQYGKTITQHVEVTGQFKDEALQIMLAVHRRNRPIHLTMSFEESFVELFDSKISTGRMIRHLNGRISMTINELEEAIENSEDNQYLPIKLVDAEIVEIFPDWFIREAERLSSYLVKDFGAEAVYLFGSLAWSDTHSPETDIDLAVLGLPPEQYFEAIGFLERESNFPVDLVELEKLSNHFRERILNEGRKLEERKPIVVVS